MKGHLRTALGLAGWVVCCLLAYGLLLPVFLAPKGFVVTFFIVGIACHLKKSGLRAFRERAPFPASSVGDWRVSLQWWNPVIQFRARGECMARLDSGVTFCLRMVYEEPWAGPVRIHAIARLFVDGRKLLACANELLPARPAWPGPDEGDERSWILRRFEIVTGLRLPPPDVASLLRIGLAQVFVTRDYFQIAHFGNPQAEDLFLILKELASIPLREPAPTFSEAGYRGVSNRQAGEPSAATTIAEADDARNAEEAWSAFPKHLRSRAGA